MVFGKSSAHEEVLTVKKNMPHLSKQHKLLQRPCPPCQRKENSTARASHTDSVHTKKTCSHFSKHAQGGLGSNGKVKPEEHPCSAHKSVYWLEDLGAERQTKNEKLQVCCCFPKDSYQQSTLS